MSWTFNPPPGWPVPPGWQPPPGWAPEPSWPPPPAGWQFWVPGRSEEPPGVHEAPTSMAQWGALSVSPGPPSFAPSPTSAPPQPFAPPQPSAPPQVERAWHQRWWAITGVVLAVFLVGCVLGGLVAVVTNSDQASGSDAGAGSRPGDTGPPPGGTGPPPGGTDPSPGATDPAGPDGPDGLGPGAERTGSGPAIVTMDLPTDGLHTVTVSYTGEGVFHARLLDQDGEFARGLGGGYGSFTGTYPLELRSYGQPGAIDIVDATGSWTVTINELSEAPPWPDEATGSGPTVLRVDPDADVSSVVVSHQGSSNVFVWGHVEGQYEELMVNEIGEWSGEVGLRTGTFVIEIDADGEWSIEPG